MYWKNLSGRWSTDITFAFPPFCTIIARESPAITWGKEREKVGERGRFGNAYFNERTISYYYSILMYYCYDSGCSVCQCLGFSLCWEISVNSNAWRSGMYEYIRIRELGKSHDILNAVTDLKKDLRTATAGFCANSLSLTILCNKKSLQYCAALYPP